MAMQSSVRGTIKVCRLALMSFSPFPHNPYPKMIKLGSST